jgi:hypothetical protein
MPTKQTAIVATVTIMGTANLDSMFMSVPSVTV